MNPKDASGQVRNTPALLMRGDIDLTKRLIHGLNFAQRYTSGVLSWSESPAEIEEATLDKIMSDFENMVGAGLEKDRLNWLWVKHQDKGRVELHFVIPNVDLGSGKRFATYFDRVDRARFRAWERLNNARHDFTDPSDPIRKRNLQLPIHLPDDKKQATQTINFVISTLIRTHHINNRDEVIQCLKKRGYEINRTGQNYISIQDKNGKKLRLRGNFYEVGFTSVDAIKIPIADTKKRSESELQKLEIELETQLKKRRDYIESRYQPIKVSDSDDVAAPAIKPSQIIDNEMSISKPTLGDSENDSIRKLSEGSFTEHAATERPTLSAIELAIRKLERTSQLFCNRIGVAIERIGGAIATLRKVPKNVFTY